MQVIMNRLSHEVMVMGIAPGASITLGFDKPLVKDADKKGEARFDCSKLIPKNLRKEIPILIKQTGENDIEHIYEIRNTKLVAKRVIEIRKEK